MEDKCPICQGENHCGNSLPKTHGSCWCTNKVFTEEVFREIPEEQLYKKCICEKCLACITTKK
ncbi:hypothetical protein DV702_07510 [Sporosarcina sp. PTS2304]|uniref:cysteine-rich CWC family protein n=1 Tax=Sporosarcina sp. PTS2304 TaxID=2283194 RepID=UPI000E0D56E7|nr:cysteine-rich CWC family protein [Sporosarcina sp. PTS2304]AXH99611.1 hypothetical protein DV702_07510 [Sporosarcina sp. PTS2304]